MTFEELLEKDLFNAFTSYKKVSVAKQLEVIPYEFHSIIKDKCPCGSDKIIRFSRSEIRCVDPRCPYKLPFYLAKSLSLAGVKGLGEETCRKLVKEYYSEEINSHIKILALSSIEGYSELNNHERFLAQEAHKIFRSRRFTYSELVSALCIPEFANTGNSIFSDIRNTIHLMDTIDSEGGYVKFMSNRGVYDPIKLFYFREFALDIAEYEASLGRKLVAPSELEIPVVTSGSLELEGRPIKTSDFIDLCNNIGTLPNGRRVFSIKDTKAVSSVDFFIFMEGFVSRSANIARERQSYTDYKIIYTPDEFVEYLKNVIRKGE